MKFFLVSISLLVSMIATAQSVDRYVTGSGGGSVAVKGYMIDFTIGQPDAIAINNGFIILTQGFQQPSANAVRQPVTLSGAVVNKNAVLRWVTQTEQNTDKFTIERANDTLEAFTPLGAMPTRAVNGNSMVPLYYTYNDLQSLGKITYYRIKVLTKDGHISYSNTIAVVAPKQSWALDNIYPNPVRTSFKAHIFTQADIEAGYMLVDVPGRVLATGKLTLNKGYNEPEINISNLPAGTYFLKLHSINAPVDDLIGKVIKSN